MNRQRAVVVTRDGVINRRVAHGFVAQWQEFEFMPGALEGLRLLAEQGYEVFVISRQECVGEGLLGWSDLERLTHRMQLEVALAGGYIADVYYCTHSRWNSCACRPPGTALLKQLLKEHQLYPDDVFLVSDDSDDLVAAWRLGVRTVLVERGAFLCDPRNRHSEVASNLAEAARRIVDRDLVSVDSIVLEELPPGMLSPGGKSSALGVLAHQNNAGEWR